MTINLSFGKFGLALKFRDGFLAKEFMKRYSFWCSDNSSIKYFAEVSFHTKQEALKRIVVKKQGDSFKFKLNNFHINYFQKKKKFKIFIHKEDIKKNSNFFPFLRIPFMILLNENGSFLFHAASIQKKRYGFGFLGPHNAGKSTIANLLKQPILNDETSLVSLEGNRAFCIGNKLGGSPEINFTKDIVELKKFFFVQKAKENKIGDITNKQYIQNLILNDFFMMYFGSSSLMRDYLKREFTLLTKLTKIVSAYKLKFNFNIREHISYILQGPL